MARRASHLVTAGTVSIDELVVLCERMAATNNGLFERLGAWVSDEPDAQLQQWFSIAGHRHAWHAELWEERRPKVPLDGGLVDADAGNEPGDDEPANRAAWYAGQLSSLQHELAALESRVDPVLDPSTQRVITLVAADIATLASSNPT